MKAKHQAALIASIVIGIENVCDLAEAMAGAEIEDGSITGGNAENLINAACTILIVEDLSAITSASQAEGHINDLFRATSAIINACGDRDCQHLMDVMTVAVIATIPTDLDWPEWMERFDAHSGLASDISKKLSKAAGLDLDIHGIFDDGLVVSGSGLRPEVIGPRHAWPFDHGQDPFTAE